MGRFASPSLDLYVSCHQNDAVIASAETTPAESSTRTILVVDDDLSVTDTFARILKMEGFKVATAGNAEAGLELADKVLPDGIILDLRMPISSGLNFLRVLRAKPHLGDVPVAIVTGDYFLSDPIQSELKTLGAALRFKPLYIEDLVTLVRTLVSA
jgi:DNA-binding response OmpR family regulator